MLHKTRNQMQRTSLSDICCCKKYFPKSNLLNHYEQLRFEKCELFARMVHQIGDVSVMYNSIRLTTAQRNNASVTKNETIHILLLLLFQKPEELTKNFTPK